MTRNYDADTLLADYAQSTLRKVSRGSVMMGTRRYVYAPAVSEGVVRKLERAGIYYLRDLVRFSETEIKKIIGKRAAEGDAGDDLLYVRQSIIDFSVPHGTRRPLTEESSYWPVTPECLVIDEDAERNPGIRYGLGFFKVRELQVLAQALKAFPGKESEAILERIMPVLRGAMEDVAKANEIDVVADAVQWTEVDGGYDLRLPAERPSDGDLFVKVWRRWDAEVAGIPVSVIMVSPNRPDGGGNLFRAFARLDGANPIHLTRDWEHRWYMACRTAVHKALALRPTLAGAWCPGRPDPVRSDHAAHAGATVRMLPAPETEEDSDDASGCERGPAP